MAIIKCPECGKEISDTTEKCIHCGKKLYNEMYLFSYDSANSKVGIECSNCGKVYSFSTSYFDKIDADSCITNTNIVCPSCNNTLPAGKEIKSKTYVSKNKMLHTCPSCGKGVSSSAFTCPHCGHPLKQQTQSSGTSFWGVVGAIIVAFLLISFLG